MIELTRRRFARIACQGTALVLSGMLMTAVPVYAQEPATLFGHELTEEQQAFLEEIKEKYANGELGSTKEIREAIEQAEDSGGFSFSEEQEKQIEDAAKALESLGDLGIKVNPDELLEKAEDLYEQYGNALSEHAGEIFKEQVVDPAIKAAEESAKQSVKGFFQEMKEALRAFWQGIKKIFG